MNELTELEFWQGYSKIYTVTEIGKHYKDLVATIKNMVNSGPNEVWLDLGCGPGRMTEIVLEKSSGQAKIVAVDIFLENAQKRLGGKEQVELICADIGKKLPFPDNYFDGIIANLSIPYIVEFEGLKGKKGIQMAFKELFRIIKPGGPLIWSTPKKNARPEVSFICSIPDIIKQRKKILTASTGLQIVKYAKELVRRGKVGTYTLLTSDEWDLITRNAGFSNSSWKYVFSHQALVNKIIKP